MTQERAGRTPLTIPGYTIKARAGRSANASLVRAHQDALARDVLIKLVPEGASDRVEAVRNEVNCKLALHHAQVAAPIDEGVAAGLRFFVMELPDGVPLSEALDAPAQRVEGIVRALYLFLAEVNDQGVCVGLLSDGDVRITAEGGVRILNLENAVKRDEGAAPLRLGKGDDALVAPEILRGKVRASVRADVYMAGALIYRALYGSGPYGPGPAPRVLKALAGGMRLSSAGDRVSPALREVLKKVLAPEPEDRPANAREVVALLDRARSRAGVRGAWRQFLSTLGVPGAAAVVLLALAVGIGVFTLVITRGPSRETVVAPPPAPADPAPPPDVPDDDGRGEEDAVGVAFRTVMEFNEAPGRTWQQKVARWEDFIAAHPDTDWTARAEALARDIAAGAQRDAQTRLDALLGAGAAEVGLLITRLEEFAAAERYSGTDAAARALERAALERDRARARARQAFAQVGALCVEGQFDRARTVVAAAIRESLDEDRERLREARAGIDATEKAWRLDAGAWAELEREARALAGARRFHDAVGRLDAARGRWSRADIAKAHSELSAAMAAARAAYAALMAEVGRAGVADRVFTYHDGDTVLEVQGRVVAVDAATGRIEVKRSGRTEQVAIDLLDLDARALLELADTVGQPARAVVLLCALGGMTLRAAQVARGAPSTDEEREALLALVRMEHGRQAAAALEQSMARAAKMLAEGRPAEAKDVVRAAVRRWGGTAAARDVRKDLAALYVTIHLAEAEAGGAGALLHGVRGDGGAGVATIEYGFRTEQEAGDWEAAASDSQARFLPRRGLEVRGRVAWKAGWDFFAPGIRFEADAEPLDGARPNINVRLCAAPAGYTLFFGLGFDGGEALEDGVVWGKLFGPENVVLVQPAAGQPWHVLHKSYGEKTKVHAGRVSRFVCSDHPARGIEFVLNGQALFVFAREALQEAIPSLEAAPQPGNVVIDTFGVPVVFRRMVLAGAAQPGWERARREQEARDAFDALWPAPEEDPRYSSADR